MKRGALIAAAATAGLVLGAGAAYGAVVDGPTPGGHDFQQPATEIMREIIGFHNGVLLPIIVTISVFVLALLLWVMIRYNRAANPTPKKFTHNMLVEVIWTVVPVLILVAIAWKSFPLIYKQEQIPPAEYTLKVTGNSWRWEFAYPDLGVNITSNLLDEETARAQGRPYLLATDTPVYVPVGAVIRVIVTSNDVIHSFAVPAFGIKEDAIQGRTNETWFRADRIGVFYGQCSELCGINHAYMPVEVHVVSREEFNQWVLAQGGALATTDAPAPAIEGQQPATQPATPAATPTR